MNSSMLLSMPGVYDVGGMCRSRSGQDRCIKTALFFRNLKVLD